MTRRPASEQLSITCEGLAPDTVTEHNVADVFAMWVARVADLNAAIAAHDMEARR